MRITEAAVLGLLLSVSVLRDAGAERLDQSVRRAKKKSKKSKGASSSKSSKSSSSESKTSQSRAAKSVKSGKTGKGKGSNGAKEVDAAATIPLAPDDLGIRFNKIVYVDQPSVPMDVQERTLTPQDYPLAGDTGVWLRQSQCPSVIMEEDCFECEMSFEALIQSVGGHPTHPSSNPDSPFWDEFREVVDMQKKRLAGVDPLEVMPLADTWKDFTIAEVAKAVHNEVRLVAVDPGFNKAILSFW